MKPIQITLDKISTGNPCHSVWRKVLEANGGSSTNRKKPFPVSSILESNDYLDTLWTLKLLPEYDRLWVRYMLWCFNLIRVSGEERKLITAADALFNTTMGGIKMNKDRLYTLTSQSGDVLYNIRALCAAVQCCYSRHVPLRGGEVGSLVFDSLSLEQRIASDSKVLTKVVNKLKVILDAGKWVE